VRAQFVLSEIGIGLRRNLTMTIAVIVTVGVSLGLAGGGWLVHKQVDLMKTIFYDKVEVTIYLCGDTSTSANCAGKSVTQEQRDQVSQDLRATPDVKSIFYESQAEAFKRFKLQFKDSPDLINNVSPDALPESFRVKLKNPQQFTVIASAFSDRPGVDSVQDTKKLLAPVFTLLGRLTFVTAFLSVVIMLASIILVSNAVRVAAFSRRRETGIMRLVGASNLYIQTPFLLEGAIAGLIGAGLACALVAGLKWFFVDYTLAPAIKFTSFIGWGVVYGMIPYMLLGGVVLCGLASLVTLRRHLRV
jgi:cell division transport system permease protein